MKSLIGLETINLSYIEVKPRWFILQGVAVTPRNFALGYKTGTTVLHLNKNCFKDFHIKLPDFDKIENFEKVVETNYKKISYNLEENNTLTQLRDNLLPKLMNGEIDLDKIEI